MNTLKGKLPKFKRKSLEVVAYWSKDAKDKKEVEKPFKVLALNTAVV